MHVNDVDIFISENWAPHPKFLYIKMLFLIQKKKEKRFLCPNFFISYKFFGRNNPIKFHTQFCFYIQVEPSGETKNSLK